jgi:hypothetical protein
MTNKFSKNKKIALVVTLAVVATGYYSYSKVNYARTVSNEIEKIVPFENEKLALERVHEIDNNFILELTLSGVTSKAKNIDEFKYHYDKVALNYICQNSNYDNQFEEGYQISLDIKYSDEPDKTFNRIYVSKEKCSELSI